jgi:hypothetical protein
MIPATAAARGVRSGLPDRSGPWPNGPSVMASPGQHLPGPRLPYPRGTLQPGQHVSAQARPLRSTERARRPQRPEANELHARSLSPPPDMCLRTLPNMLPSWRPGPHPRGVVLGRPSRP